MPDTTPMTDAEWAAAVKAMADAGAQAGEAAGSWIADGNTDEATLWALLKMWDEGDPAAPCPPSPFSGEWADEPNLYDVIGSETDVDIDTLEHEEADELASAFEEAYCEAWYIEAERTVRGLLHE